MPAQADGLAAPVDTQAQRLAQLEQECVRLQAALDAAADAQATEARLGRERLAAELLSQIDAEFAALGSAIAQHLQTLLAPILHDEGRRRAITAMLDLMSGMASGHPLPALQIACPAELKGALLACAEARGLSICIIEQESATLMLDLGRSRIIASLEGWRDALLQPEGGT